MTLDDVVEIPSESEIRDYIYSMVEGLELDGVYINGTYIRLSWEYLVINKEEGKITISGYGLSATWDVNELVDKVIKEKGKDWYDMSDEERKEYISNLFVKGEEE